MNPSADGTTFGVLWVSQPDRLKCFRHLNGTAPCRLANLERCSLQKAATRAVWSIEWSKQGISSANRPTTIGGACTFGQPSAARNWQWPLASANALFANRWARSFLHQKSQLGENFWWNTWWKRTLQRRLPSGDEKGGLLNVLNLAFAQRESLRFGGIFTPVIPQRSSVRARVAPEPRRCRFSATRALPAAPRARPCAAGPPRSWAHLHT